jgi:hypothetical protein
VPGIGDNGESRMRHFFLEIKGILYRADDIIATMDNIGMRI